MLTPRQQEICDKYSQRGPDGKVQCDKCPLVVDAVYMMCRANATYNRHKQEWVPDYKEE